MKRVFGRVVLALLIAGCSRDESPLLPQVRQTADAVKLAVRGIYRVESAAAEKPRFVSIDVAGLTAADLKAKFESFPNPSAAHLWMPGEQSWLVVEQASTNAIALEAAMEAVATDESCMLTFPEIFASYAGTLADVLPAFAAKLEGEVVPEWFVTKDVPSIDWLVWDEVDADIAEHVRQEIRSMQVVRRLILEGNMSARVATDKKSEEEATEKWARAYLRNPHDPLLNERLTALEKNAKGFLELNKVVQAMKCYETMVLINPKDAVAVHNFGMCLKKIGREDMAKEVLERAKALKSMPLR